MERRALIPFDDAFVFVGTEEGLALRTLAATGKHSFDALERIRLHRFKTDVQFKQLLAQLGPFGEIIMERQAGGLARQVDGVLLAVDGVMQDRVGVGEYLLRRDGLIIVVVTELPQAPLGDVADPRPVLPVAVEREALGSLKMQSFVRQPV